VAADNKRFHADKLSSEVTEHPVRRFADSPRELAYRPMGIEPIRVSSFFRLKFLGYHLTAEKFFLKFLIALAEKNKFTCHGDSSQPAFGRGFKNTRAIPHSVLSRTAKCCTNLAPILDFQQLIGDRYLTGDRDGRLKDLLQEELAEIQLAASVKRNDRFTFKNRCRSQFQNQGFVMSTKR
jgi:hypothetical protein